MRSMALCAVLLGLTVRVAAAQGVPITLEDAPSVAVAGYAVGSANYDRLGPNGPTNSFSGDKIALTLYEQAGGDVYFYGQLTTTLSPGVTSSVGIDIDHLYVIWTPHTMASWSFEFGRLPIPGGVENDDEPLNFVPMSSFLFQFARPSAITGAIARFTPVGNFQFVFAVADAWDVEQAINNGKTGVVRAEWLPTDGVTLGITGIYGPQFDSTTAAQRTLGMADFTVQKGPLILALELDDGEQAQPLPGHWGGGEVEAFYQFARKWAISARYEDVNDLDGVVTGIPQILSSFTIGPMFFQGTGEARMITNIEHTTFHIPQLWVRVGIRADYSTAPFFANSSGGFEMRDTRGIVQVCFMF
jgi:hypothetical protein